MSGRLDVLFLDIDKTRNDANRLMTAGGIAVIENARQRAREKWYKSVNA
jgi:predicted O-methyltransferase YrrM